MEQRCIGKNGPLVSGIGIGCMGFSQGYGPTNDTASLKILNKAIDLGVSFLDTADAYGWGHNEGLISKILKNKRDKVTVATKVGIARKKNGANMTYFLQASPQHIKSACDASLKRLKIDTIDLYYLHRVDPNTPIEESIGAMSDLVKAGKIRHIGISEVKPETIKRATKIHPISAIQTEYSLWERYPENEIIPICRELGITFVAYGPLGRGFLTGTITDLDTLAPGDLRFNLPRFQKNNFLHNKKLLVEFKQIAEEKQCTLSQLALAWILKHPSNIIPIPGINKLSHLEDNLKALEISLTQNDISKLEEVFHLNAAKGKKYHAEHNSEA